MGRHVRTAVAVAALVLVGCTSTEPDPTPASPASTDDATPSGGTSTPAAPSPSPSPEDAAFGTGTVTVDGTEVPVSGDCDISRDFGQEPVEGLDEDVDVLLAVDNIAGDGRLGGDFALQVRLLGDGEVVGRTITSQGAPGADAGSTADVTYEGAVEVAELRDRRELDFLDSAVLHLEASQERVSGSGGPSRRTLVVDVVCPVSRPG